MKDDQILTPVGRLVQGDCFKAQTHDQDRKLLLNKSGPNAGKPRVKYFIALAISKTAPGIDEILEKIRNAARMAFPRMFDAAGNPTATVALKYSDGDDATANKDGLRPCDREGFAGNWILRFESGFAPKCYTFGGAERIPEDDGRVKTGYFVRVYGNVRGNGSTQNPGVFLSPRAVELVGYGPEINTGVNAAAIFGGAPAAIPPGVSATPLASPTPIAAASPAQPASPAPSVPPANDFLDGPQSVVEYRLDAQGNKFTRAQFKTAGFSDQQIDALRLA
jgi:hypothetical protein